jgi:hypothetical protein
MTPVLPLEDPVRSSSMCSGPRPSKPRRPPFVRRNPAAPPDPEWIGYSSDTDGEGPPPQTVPMPWPMLGRTGRVSRPDQASRHSPLGSFQHTATGAVSAGLAGADHHQRVHPGLGPTPRRAGPAAGARWPTSSAGRRPFLPAAVGRRPVPKQDWWSRLTRNTPAVSARSRASSCRWPDG